VVFLIHDELGRPAIQFRYYSRGHAQPGEKRNIKMLTRSRNLVVRGARKDVVGTTAASG